MTDKELLEYAAKAAGNPLQYSGGVHWYGKQAGWNPLKDDGDALRLAVKLDLLIDINSERQKHGNVAAVGKHKSCIEPFVNDPYSATRRAIVRTAAQIGKEMK